MKKTIITTALCIACMFGTHAQISLGGGTGLVISQAGNDYTDNDQVGIPIVSIPLNAVLEIPFTKSLCLQTGFSIMRKGGGWKEKYANGSFEQYSYHLGTLEFPAILKLTLNPHGKFRFNALAGFYVGYMTGGRIKFKDEVSKETEKMDLDYYSFEDPIDFGFKTGIQGDIILKQGTLFITPTLHLGVKDNDADSDFIYKQRAVMVSIGYLYTFKKKAQQNKTSN